MVLVIIADRRPWESKPRCSYNSYTLGPTYIPSVPPQVRGLLIDFSVVLISGVVRIFLAG